MSDPRRMENHSAPCKIEPAGERTFNRVAYVPPQACIRPQARAHERYRPVRPSFATRQLRPSGKIAAPVANVAGLGWPQSLYGDCPHNYSVNGHADIGAVAIIRVFTGSSLKNGRLEQQLQRAA